MRSPPSNPPLYNNIIIQSALVYIRVQNILYSYNNKYEYIYVIPRRIMGVHDDDTPNRTERNPENNVDVPRQCWT